MSRVGELGALRSLSSTITSIQTNTQGAKMIRASMSLLRCMMFFDLCYLITGISLITVGLANEYYNRDRMIILGGAFGAAATISAICNSLAVHGLRSWRRGFLVPWMVYYLIIILLIVMILARSFYFEHINLRQLFLFLSCLALFSCWKHFQRQFALMAFPRPEQMIVDVEAVVRDLIGQSQVAPATQYEAGKDLPPKYEDVEDLPPQYDPSTMTAEAGAPVQLSAQLPVVNKP
jgi:hypothetical protein